MNIEGLGNIGIELPDEFDGLPVFVVGGFVRDTIRGEDPEDIDLMVAEVTPDEMRERGFREIDSPNNDTFGVFQDSLGREVAIAREESPSDDADDSNPHTAFDVEPIDPSVEAADAVLRDLERRDFTVNAMAFDLRWDVLLDPHNGAQDLQEGVIRAVSADSFEQDPLRILRGARFAARLDANIDPTTKDLMQEARGGLLDLPQERVRMELEKSLVEAETPRIFFDMLSSIGALELTFPEIAQLRDIPAGPDEFHSEGSAFQHSMMVLQEMKRLRPIDETALLMALFHDIGKIETPLDELPSHPAHGKNGVPVIEDMADRLSMSNEQKNALVEASRQHMKLHDINDLRESTVIDMWQQIDNQERMFDLMVADARGREPPGDAPRGEALRRFAAAETACAEWSGSRLIEEGYDPDEMGGEDFGDLLRQKRVERMREIENND